MDAFRKIEELEKRIQSMEDLEEIKKLHQTYIDLMDNLHYEEVLDLFTEDGTCEVLNSGIKRGKKEMSEVYLGRLAKNRGSIRYDGHLAVQPDIKVTGDTATGVWLIYMLFSKPSVQWVALKSFN
jgi:hypothetical protein